MKARIKVFITSLAYLIGISTAESEKDLLLVTDKVLFDIKIGDNKPERVVFGIFGKNVLKTGDNFVALAMNPRGYGYRGSKIHAIIPGFAIKAGDYIKGDGTRGRSAFGENFPDESFDIKHSSAGWLTMDNSGPDSNDSKFMITLNKIPWLDGKNVVFGKVLRGMSTIRKIEKLETGPKYRPLQDVVIFDCDIEIVKKPFNVTKEEPTD